MGISISSATSDTALSVLVNKALLKQEVRYDLLNDFEQAIGNGTKKLYVFYGRPNEFPNSDTVPTPTNSLLDEEDTRKTITAMRKVFPSEVRRAFKKYTWSSGTRYNQYSNRVDTTAFGAGTSKPYYVLTQDERVYKVISNNNGAQSTVEPREDRNDIFTTSDGYRWKLLIKYEGSLLRKFNSATHLPFPDTNNIQTALEGGEVDRLVITDTVSPISNKYTGLSEVPFFVEGDAPLTITALAEFKVTSVAPIVGGLTGTGKLKADGIELTSGGAGYFFDSTAGRNKKIPVKFRIKVGALTDTNFSAGLNVTTGFGLATIDQTSNTVSAIDVIDPGAGYPVGAIVEVVQSPAIVYGQLNAQKEITSFEITRNGKGFKSANLVSVVDPEANIQKLDSDIDVILSPSKGHGGDIQKELNASALFINVRVSSSNEDFTIANDFRQVGLIENPNRFGSTTSLTETTADAKFKFVLEGADQSTFENINEDAAINGQISGAKGIFVDKKNTAIGARKLVRYIKDPSASAGTDFVLNERVLINTDTPIPFNVISITNPEVDVNSGNILFINNNNKQSRQTDQIETINFIINF
tara:strand:- start:238 stop:1989 length:1752 start_codon:yes stop_codon:yes gene_type:complete